MTGSSKSSKPKDWLMSLAGVVLPAPMLPARATKRRERGALTRRTVLRASGSGSGEAGGGEVGSAGAGVAARGASAGVFGARLRAGERGIRAQGLTRGGGRVQDLAQQGR